MDLVVDIEVELACGVLTGRGVVQAHEPVAVGYDDGWASSRARRVRLTLECGTLTTERGVTEIAPGTYVVDGDGTLSLVIDGTTAD